MLKDLSPDERNLAELMSRISEESFTAGWMDGLEFELWDILKSDSSKHGYVITQNEIEELRSLSQICGCWIIYDNAKEETSVDIEVWKKVFNDKFNTA